MTHHEYERLVNKLARVQGALDHDATRLPEHSYAQRALQSASASIEHAMSMINIYYLQEGGSKHHEKF
jgi:hypothetical protein